MSTSWISRVAGAHVSSYYKGRQTKAVRILSVIHGIKLHDVDLDLLLKLRLVVARFGEMDSAGWWNTNGVLSDKGAMLYSRGFPKTHYFAQARVVFAVASQRCKERFSGVAGAVTLWDLPAQIEDAFDSKISVWIESGQWADFFEQLKEQERDLVEVLRSYQLITQKHVEKVVSLRRSAEERAVLITGIDELDDDSLKMLAAAFARSEPGKLAVPYIKFGGAE